MMQNPPYSLFDKGEIKQRFKKGFTLVELLVVISIIGILTIITVSTFVTAQKKGHDAQKKAELDSLSKALMTYYNDYGRFPTTLNLAKGNLGAGLIGNDGYVYMKQLPSEKYLTGEPLVYEVSALGKSFNLFADLENKADSSCDKTGWTRNGIKYCYGVASPNTTVGTTTLDN